MVRIAQCRAATSTLLPRKQEGDVGDATTGVVEVDALLPALKVAVKVEASRDESRP
jgi:hypothetical protein